MFHVPRGLIKGFSGGFLTSFSLPATDLEWLIRNLIFISLKFKQIAFKQCPPLLAIPMIWNHLVSKALSLFTGMWAGVRWIERQNLEALIGLIKKSWCPVLEL